MRKKLKGAIAAALVTMTSGVDAATVDIVAMQVGTDVVVTGSGSIDLSGLVPTTYGNAENVSGFGGFGVFTSSHDAYIFSGAFTALTTINVQPFSTTSGDNFGISDTLDLLILPNNYASLSAINFTWTVLNFTISDVNFGTLATVGQNTIISSQTPVVPLPAGLPLLLGGLGALGALRLRLRRKRTA